MELQGPGRRSTAGVAARRLGDGDEWGVGAARAWSSVATRAADVEAAAATGANNNNNGDAEEVAEDGEDEEAGGGAGGEGGEGTVPPAATAVAAELERLLAAEVSTEEELRKLSWTTAQAKLAAVGLSPSARSLRRALAAAKEAWRVAHPECVEARFDQHDLVELLRTLLIEREEVPWTNAMLLAEAQTRSAFAQVTKRHVDSAAAVVRREVVEMRELQQHNLSGCSLSDKVEEARRQLRELHAVDLEKEPFTTSNVSVRSNRHGSP